MIHRAAATVALIAFAACLVVGAAAGNAFTTTVGRALLAMGGMYVIGLAVGAAARKMLDENLRAEEEKLRKSAKTETHDR